MAFQVVDDVLDVVATDEQLGKPAGHDIAEGIYNLPGAAGARGGRARRRAPALHARRPVDGRTSSRPPATWSARRSASRSPIEVARGYVDQAVEMLAPFGERPATTALAGAAAHLLVDLASVRSA